MLNEIKTVEQARRSGFKVRVGHFRLDTLSFFMYSNDKRGDPDQYMYLQKELADICPRGGKTIVSITKDGKDCFGQTYCSLQDNYCKKTGVKLALERALSLWMSL